MTDKCEPGMVWILKNKWSAAPMHASVLLWERPVGNRAHGYVQVPDEDLITTFGESIPGENEAWLISTREVEGYCPVCNKWFSRWAGASTLVTGTAYPACPECPADVEETTKLTKSRCRVIETIKLEDEA